MKILRLAAFLLFVSTICLQVAGQGTAFTYQGTLNHGGAPANGSYDIQFTLYTTNVTGSPVAGPVINSATSVSNGLFTAIVDFGPGVFNGQALWLDVSVSPAGSNTFTELTPRQPLASTPYAVLAANANAAATAGSVSAANISGTLTAGQLPPGVLTNGASNVNISGTFSGNGANITGLNLLNVNSDGAITLKTNWGSFTKAATLPVGHEPYSVVAADVNGDGKVDLISANFGNNTLTVLTNNGSGGFAVASTLAVGSLPASVIAADVNGDGKVDLICANVGQGLNDGTLTILTNNGSGGFAIASSPGAGAEPYSVTAADVNGDGKVDLICADVGSDTLTILTNNGSGGFAIASFPFVGPNGYYVTAADVNGDGKVDLICANIGNDTLTVLTNNGSGGFATACSPSVGSDPYSVAAADVNGDGKVDLICANDFDNTLTILTNNGSGGLFTIASSPAVGVTPVSVTAADVNGDGKVDLICANEGNHTLTILTNNGSGGFAVSSSPSVGGNPVCVIAADVNGDGHVDLICANEEDDTLTVLTNTPVGVTASISLAGLPAAAVPNGDTGVNLSGTFTGGISATNFAATTVTNFAQVSGPLPASFSFTSHGGRLLIRPIGSGWTTSGAAIIGMTVTLDGTAILTDQIYANAASFHMPFEPRTVVLNNISAGSHTLTFTALSGTTIDGSDFFSATVQELPY